MPAAIGDYASKPAKQKIESGGKSLDVTMHPLAKIIEAVRRKAPKAVLVAFKAESDKARLMQRASERLKRYRAQFIVANTAGSFGAPTTTAHLVDEKGGTSTFSGPKEQVLAAIVQATAS